MNKGFTGTSGLGEPGCQIHLAPFSVCCILLMKESIAMRLLTGSFLRNGVVHQSAQPSNTPALFCPGPRTVVGH